METEPKRSRLPCRIGSPWCPCSLFVSFSSSSAAVTVRYICCHILRRISRHCLRLQLLPVPSAVMISRHALAFPLFPCPLPLASRSGILSAGSPSAAVSVRFVRVFPRLQPPEPLPVSLVTPPCAVRLSFHGIVTNAAWFCPLYLVTPNCAAYSCIIVKLCRKSQTCGSLVI